MDETALTEASWVRPKRGLSLTGRRSAGAAALLDQALQRAEAAGLLGFFNREYRRRRREAAAAHKSFVSYGTARRRLQQVVAKAIADGGAFAPSMIVQVFESG